MPILVFQSFTFLLFLSFSVLLFYTIDPFFILDGYGHYYTSLIIHFACKTALE